jgi:hypothetical protein
MINDKNGWRSEVTFDSNSSELNILAGIEVHIELDLSLEGSELLLSFADAANDNNSGDDN